MHVYIDESGSFVPAPNPNSWCVVAALVAPETSIRRLRALLASFKLACGKKYDEEVKLRDVTEHQYFTLLRNLASIDCTLYAVATDMSLSSEPLVRGHQEQQIQGILRHIDMMKYEEGRASLRKLSEEVAVLSPQLYMQLVCQVHLIKDVIDRAILYHVQRTPGCLRQFRWRIDQKNTTKSQFEITFEKVAPSLLQSIALEEPSIACADFDYSAMRNFIYDDQNAPTYLRDAYGFDVNPAGGLNIGKVLRTDIDFPESSTEAGLQAVDLLASGIGRLLRGRISENPIAASLLGSIMVQNLRGKYPIQLISFADDQQADPGVADAVKEFEQHAKPMLLSRSKLRSCAMR